jgi:cell shape-determining protein MreD
VKQALALLAAGLLALVVQGALATLLVPPWCPDLALLVLIGIGLRWEGGAGGLLLAATLGYATDLLSGSLLGQHAILALFAFSSTRIATRHLNLQGPWPLAFFAACVSLLFGFAMLAITGFFVGGAQLAWGWLAAQLIHAAVTGAFAPGISAAVGRLADWVADDEGGYRPIALRGRVRTGGMTDLA